MRTPLATLELFPLQDTPIEGPIAEAFVTVTDPAVACVRVCPPAGGSFPGADPFLELVPGTFMSARKASAPVTPGVLPGPSPLPTALFLG